MPFLGALAFPFRRFGLAAEPSLVETLPRRARPRLMAVPNQPAALPTMMSSDPLLNAKVLAAMLDVLDNYLPPNPVLNPPLPDPNLTLVSAAERSVGLGSRVGTNMRGPFTVSAVKGARLEAVVRYQLWSDDPVNVDAAIQDLVTRLLTDREVLRALGFLRLVLKSTGEGQVVPAVNNYWRESVDFEVLYEFPYVDSDDAQSLIASIPINIDDDLATAMTVSDEMARWDNLTAPPLLLRGPLTIGRLSALAFIPGTAPTGKVTLTRTFDGAAGSAPVHPDLPTFLAAIADPHQPPVSGQVVFASLSDFLNAFSPDGTPITLGDWDEDLAADDYDASALAIVPSIKLPRVQDRFEISYETAAFDQIAVVYLRAT